MDLLQQNDILQQPGSSNFYNSRLSKNDRKDYTALSSIKMSRLNANDRHFHFANSSRRRRKGHLRGTRSNGFASGPPFPKFSDKRRLKRNSETDYYCDEYPWGAPLNEQQKKQQMALIEHVSFIIKNA
jgi:hypothetical protein